MFNNNVTQTYNFQDASQEIIIMLLGAFILGSLLTWLLSKLFNKDYSVESNSYRYGHQDDEINKLSQTPVRPAATTSDVRIVKTPTNPISRTVPSIDDLTKISGIDSDMLFELKRQGITSYTDLRDIKTKDLKVFQNNRQNNKRVIETWPHQASLATKEEWDKLKDYQDFIQRAQIASKNSQTNIPQDADDLKVVEGISSEIENILNQNKIYTFKQLSHIDSDILKKHVVEADSKFHQIDTDTWSHQAAMAEKGQWDELKIYQEFMHSDSEVSSSSLNDQSVDNAANEDISIDEQNLSDHDDLKKIDGIGPKIETILNKGGIYTFSQLYNSDRDRLRKLLDDGGNQFRIHDPQSWPHQAGMANRSEWTELKSYQTTINKDQVTSFNSKSLSTKIHKDENKTDSETSTVSQSDNFKKIEGIGPKIEELLNNAGIKSFAELAETSSDSIKELLNQAGPQFRMHEPKSWPHQAKLAANGDWSELEKYKDFLISGQEK